MYAAFDRFAGTGGAKPRDWSAELRTLYGGLRERAVAAQRRQEEGRAKDTRPSLPLERYAGTYSDPTYGDVVVTVRDGALQLAYGGERGRTGRLEHWQYETFRARWADVRRDPTLVVFTPDGTGGVSGVRAFGVTFARTRQMR